MGRVVAIAERVPRTPSASELKARARVAALEELFEELGVDWSFEPAFELDRVDVNASLLNNTDPLHDETVDRYAADMERGDVFPAIVVNTAKGKVTTLGGNHRRTAAARIDRGRLPAYLIAVSDAATIMRITFEDNRRHGLPLGDDERLDQAAMLLGRGFDQKEVAYLVGLSIGKLERAVAVSAADVRADRIGVGHAWLSLPRTSRWRLGSISDDDVFEVAARTVLASRMSSDSVNRLVTRLGTCFTKETQLAVIEQAHAHAHAHASDRSQRRRGPWVQLQQAFEIIALTDPYRLTPSLNPQDRTVLRRRIRDCVEALKRIMEAL
jgi:hypothetical protein